MDVITYMLGLKLNHVSKRGPRDFENTALQPIPIKTQRTYQLLTTCAPGKYLKISNG